MYESELQYTTFGDLPSEMNSLSNRVGPCLDGERNKLMPAMKRRDEHADDDTCLLYRSYPVAAENDRNMYTPENRHAWIKQETLGQEQM